MAKVLNPYEIALQQLANAAEVINLEQPIHEVLKYPERLLEVSIPVHMDDGSTKVFKGFRSQHSTARGP